MSVFTERGASSSSMNLMNSSMRLPEGAGMQNPRTGSVLSVGFSAADRVKAPVRSRHRRFKFRVMVGISAIQWISAQRPASNRAGQLRAGSLDGPVRVFGVNDFPHELRGELRVLVRELNPQRLAVHHGQLVAQLVAGVAAVADLVHGPREVAIV